jgi:hypothetical protein
MILFFCFIRKHNYLLRPILRCSQLTLNKGKNYPILVFNSTFVKHRSDIICCSDARLLSVVQMLGYYLCVFKGTVH